MVYCIYVHNDFEISSKWTGISQIMKKDFVLVDAYVSPLKREQNYTLYCIFHYLHFNTIEGESLWPKKCISNLFQRTLYKYLAIII